jgi:hypothetical protein
MKVSNLPSILPAVSGLGKFEMLRGFHASLKPKNFNE